MAALGPGGAACAAPAQANACLLDNVLASAITAGTAKSGYYYGVGGVVAGALVLTYTVGSSAAVFIHPFQLYRAVFCLHRAVCERCSRPS